MKTKHLISSVIATVAMSCAAATEPNYTVKVNLTPDEDGLQLFMVNYDNGERIDSTLVDNGIAIFQGHISEPVMAQLVLDGTRAGQIILEPGEITVDPAHRSVESTGKLSRIMKDATARQHAIITEYNALPQDSTTLEQRKAIEAKFDAYNDSLLMANSDNVLGLSLFLQNAYGYGLSEFDAELAKYPYMAKSVRVGKLRDALIKKAETSEGHKYKDFEITYEGKTYRLSDYVGKGKYTLVDFWASWCGPCIRETKVIKELYNKYSDKGLEVLGVAVWDEPANTLKAITQHELPWKQIINAQTIPTDLYGISGIPCIILFDPDGNIISRDKQDQELIDAVDAAMAKVLVEAE